VRLRERRRPFGRPRRRFQDNIGVLAGYVREDNHLGDLGIDSMIVLERSLRRGVGRQRLHLCSSGYEQMAGSGDCGNEPAVSIKVLE